MIVGAKSGRLDGPAQQQRSKLPGVTGSSPAPPYNTPVTDDTVVQAWRSDAVNLDGRLMKLRRNTGQSATVRGEVSVQKEIQGVLALAKSSSSSSSSSAAAAAGNILAARGFSSADDAVVVLSLQLGLAQVCLRKLDNLAKVTLGATGGMPSAGGAEVSLVRTPESVVALLDRTLDLHDECAASRKANPPPPKSSSSSSGKENAAAGSDANQAAASKVVIEQLRSRADGSEAEAAGGADEHIRRADGLQGEPRVKLHRIADHPRGRLRDPPGPRLVDVASGPAVLHAGLAEELADDDEVAVGVEAIVARAGDERVARV